MNTAMTSRLCPLCASSDDSRVFAEANFDFTRLGTFAFSSRKLPEYMHYRLIRCPVCDLLYASPVPAADFLAKGYEESDFDSATEARYASRTYGAFLPKIIRKLPDLDGAVDIGTGDGAFLVQLRERGFSTIVGIEPSRAPVAAAREDVLPMIRLGQFHAGDFAPNSLSLVTCFQTLEHLPDPKELCSTAYRMLKQGGAIFFICHNYRSLSSRVLGLKSPIFDIEHLQLFSPKSIGYLLEQAGFIGREIKTVYNRYPLRYWMKLFPLPENAKRKLLALLDASGTGGLPVPLPAGNIAAIGYKP